MPDFIDSLLYGIGEDNTNFQDSLTPGSSTPPHLFSPPPQGWNSNFFSNVSPITSPLSVTPDSNMAMKTLPRSTSSLTTEYIRSVVPAHLLRDPPQEQLSPQVTKRRRLNAIGSYTEPVTLSSQDHSEECHCELDKHEAMDDLDDAVDRYFDYLEALDRNGRDSDYTSGSGIDDPLQELQDDFLPKLPDDFLEQPQCSAESLVPPDPATANEPMQPLEQVMSTDNAEDNIEEVDEDVGYVTIEIENPQECEFCHNLFVDEDDLSKHKERCHHNQNASNNSDPATTKKRCPKCLVWLTPGSFRRHVEIVHCKGASVKCTHCETTFRSKKSMSVHLREIHGEDPPSVVKQKAARIRASGNQTRKKLFLYKCILDSACNHQTTTKGNMQRHVITNHKKLRPFKCRFCDHSSRTHHNLLSHEAIHTREGSKKRKRRLSSNN